MLYAATAAEIVLSFAVNPTSGAFTVSSFTIAADGTLTRSTDSALIFENWAAGASDGVAATGIAQ